MSKNVHTYRAKLDALWSQMRHTVEYVIRSQGLEWVADNCSEVIDVSEPKIGVVFSGTADDVATAVDDLVLKGLRKTHNDPNYTI